MSKIFFLSTFFWVSFFNNFYGQETNKVEVNGIIRGTVTEVADKSSIDSALVTILHSNTRTTTDHEGSSYWKFL